MAYIGKQPQIGNYIKLDAITTSATTTFNLTAGGVAVYPQTATNCIVSLNGIIQAPTDAYTISGSTIVFASALTASDVIDFITVLGDVLNIGTPSDGTVSLAKLTATGTKDSTTFLRGDNTFQTIGTNTPAFIVRRATSNQSISSSTWTKVQFNSEILDSNNCFDSTTNYRFTPTTSGYYSYKINLNMGGTSISFVALAIYKNGSEVFLSSHFNNTEVVYNGGSVIVNMNGTTDYVEGYAYIIATSPYVGNHASSVFSGYKLIGI